MRVSICFCPYCKEIRRRKAKMKTITCIPQLGNDKWWRITIDVYYCFGKVSEIKSILKKKTGIDWRHFGTFMDTACYATKEKPPKEFSVNIPWEE
jgi:hypothetical protein